MNTNTTSRLGQPEPPGGAPSISLVLPAYNEQDTLEQAIAEADTALAEFTLDYEILVIDDGSTDETAAIARAQARQRPHVKLLSHPRNIGYGAALRSGFAAASKELVAFTDADCQFDLRELDRLILLARDYDIVCGYRIDRQDAWHRKLISRVYNLVVSLLLSTRLRDIDCAFKVFQRDTIKSLLPEEHGFFANAGIITKAWSEGKSLVEVGVTHRARHGGASTVSWRHGLPMLSALLRCYWNSRFAPAQSQPEPTRWNWGTEAAAFSLLCVISAFVFLHNLSYVLIEPDETRYAQIALEMYTSGDWLTPTLDGVPYLDKPPLLYWMTAASYAALGVSPAAARLPSAICGLATVLSVFLLGRSLIGGRGAWFGAIALMLCGGFVLAGRFLITDAPLTLCTTVALFAAYLACRGPTVHSGWLLCAGLACGLGILAKGPIAVVLCLPPVLALQWLAGERATLRVPHWLTLVGAACLIALPWFVGVSVAHNGFTSEFLWKHHFVRFFSAFNHREPVWFYIPVILVGMFPTSALLPTLAVVAHGTAKPLGKIRSPQMGFLLLSAGWVILFFSISSCKLPTYILPALPPLCLAIGSMLDRAAFRSALDPKVAAMLRPIPRRLGIILLVIGVAALGVKIALENQAGGVWTLDVLGFVATVLLLAVICSISFLEMEKRWAVSTILSVLVVTYVMVNVVPLIAGKRSVHSAAAGVQQHHQDVPIAYFEHEAYGLALQGSRVQPAKFRAYEVHKFEQFASRHGEVVLVTDPFYLNYLKSGLDSSYALTPVRGGRHVYVVTSSAATPVRVADKSALQGK